MIQAQDGPIQPEEIKQLRICLLIASEDFGEIGTLSDNKDLDADLKDSLKLLQATGCHALELPYCSRGWKVVGKVLSGG